MAGGWYCRECASAAGMAAAPKNVAEENSKAWKAKPCKHQAVKYSYETKWVTNYQVTHCVRCGKEVTRLIVGYHGKRR